MTLKITDEYGTTQIEHLGDDEAFVTAGGFCFDLPDVYMDRICRLWLRYKEMKGNA